MSTKTAAGAASMLFDAERMDAAVRASVGRIISLQRNEKENPQTRRQDEMAPAVRKAELKLLVPLVARELRRRAIAKVKRAVRLYEAVGTKAAFAQSCIVSSEGKAGKKKPSAVASALASLGSGANGDVFAIDAARAVKLVVMHRKGDEDLQIAEFQREAEMSRAAARIGVGPAVLSTFVCMADLEGQLAGVIVMRRLKGKTLKDWADSKPSDARRRVMEGRIEALLAKMHGASIYHNDMHAGNVMVEKGDRPLIIDYGLASSSKDNDNFELKKRDKKHADFRVVDFLRGNAQWWRESLEFKKFVERVLDDMAAHKMM